MISTIVAVTVPGFAVGAILMALANRRTGAPLRRERWLKLASYFVIVHAVLLAAWLGRPFVLALAALVLAAGSWELVGALRRRAAWPLPARLLAAAVYAGLAAAWVAGIAGLPPMTVAFLYLAVASFDGFSQTVGQLAGRHSIAVAVSPAKTVEGALGGAVGASIVAMLVRGLAGLTAAQAVALGVAISLCALAGDLAGSWVKRRAGIKDFSALIPGHGGVLDRFGSFISAGALIGPALACTGGVR